MKNKLAVAGLTVGLVGGAAAGLALAVPNLATAQTSTTAPPAAATSPSTTTPDATAKPDRSAKLKETLAPLVADGTITQAQADKVIAAIEAARPEGGRGFGPGGRHGVGEGLEAAAKAIGVTEADLRQALKDGKTVAAVAKEKGVDIQKVIDAVVAEAKTRLDVLVKDGTITQAQADERLTNATDRIKKLVDTVLPARGERGHGPGRDGQDATPPTTTS